jgi:hypothetical protein
MRHIALTRPLHALLFCGIALFSGAATADPLCTYSTYKWNIHTRTAVGLHKVSKPYGELTAAEKDNGTGCTVCEEDQVELSFPGLRPFKVCKRLAPDIEKIVNELQLQHAPVRDVVGYRVGMTRGNPDSAGNRTGFSNHSFGVALDINTAQNGLYENCFKFGPGCRLIKGGPWKPEQDLSLTGDSLIVRAFKKNGFKWGGEIAGQQKDFMHFSPTGY